MKKEQNFEIVFETVLLQNRIHDSLQLFEQVCNNKHFVHTDCIVYLNKKDLLQLKFPYSPFKKAFTEYIGSFVTKFWLIS